MADYIHSDDGKIHTRYTELAKCSPGAMAAIIAERLGNKVRVETPIMEWGTDRHDMWESEGRATGRVPSCFQHLGGGLDVMTLESLEEEYRVELFPGVVIHLRPDAVSKTSETILDYKTATEPANSDWSVLEDGEQPTDDKWKDLIAHYRNSRQLKFYTFMLGVNNIRIRRGVYLIEVWDKTHTRILGYFAIWQEYSLAELAKLLPWTRDRVALLVAAVREAQNAGA